ncbi:MAG: hypothetical protein J6T74_02805 [Clostridia bacterium]|nr:hypothetical protein [Clostridia bacterium]
MRKIRLVSLLVLLVLSLSIVGYGVYAATSAQISSMSGSIQFKSNNVSATVTCYQRVGSGSWSSAQATKTLTGTTDSGTWAVSSLSFATNTVGSAPSGSATYSVSLKFNVANSATRSLYAYFTNSAGSTRYSSSSGATLTSSISSSTVNVSFPNKTTVSAGSNTDLIVTFTIPNTNNTFTRNETISFNYVLHLNRFDPDA